MSGGYGPGGYPGQGYDEDPRRPRPRGRGYGGPGYGPQDYGPQDYGPQDYGRQGTGGYRGQGSGQRPGRYGGAGRPRYDHERQGNGPRGYDEWGSGDSDEPFMPGFGGRGGYDNGRYPERDDRDDDYDDYGDYDDRRFPPGPGGGGPRPDPDDYWEDRNPPPRKKATRWLPRILVLAIVAAIVGGGLYGGLDVYHRYEGRYHPADYAGPGTGDVTVQVKSGASAFSLAPELLSLGVIASTRAFENAAEAATSTAGSGAPGLEAGYYQLHYHMKASLAYAALTNPKNLVQTTVTIPEGERVSQVLAILAKYSKIPLAQFEAAAKETSKLGLPSYAGTTAKLPATVPYGQLEGYLFPATYAITPHETALQILQAMVARFNVEAEQVNIQQAAQSVGLTPGKLIIEASMVQAEAGLNSDMPKMASVINNRTKAGMPDGFDSVVFYGLGKFGINIPNDLNPATAGPYDNTQQPGLPPTPIDNPGDAAIQAILHPAKTNYLYFLTVATGKATEFSATPLPGTG